MLALDVLVGVQHLAFPDHGCKHRGCACTGASLCCFNTPSLVFLTTFDDFSLLDGLL